MVLGVDYSVGGLLVGCFGWLIALVVMIAIFCAFL